MTPPVEMTNLWLCNARFPMENGLRLPNNFVISTAVAMDLRTTHGEEKCLGRATTFYRTVTLSFVIPSEAEGPAVPRTFVEMFFREPLPTKLTAVFVSV
jgi:hypothetical protein